MEKMTAVWYNEDMKRKNAVKRGLVRMFGWVMVIPYIIYIIYGGSAAFADVNNFYFEDFTGDYYLGRAEDGTSRLHVKEVLTAVFPETNQNHGITRAIPIYNQDGANLTVQNYGALNLTVLRNGVKEPVGKVEFEGDYYNIYIGDADKYVTGRQVYTLEYDFANVVTEFDAEGNNVGGTNKEGAFQELYWDTNGNGWTQKFNRVTARVHFVGDVAGDYAGKSWCYVGRYGVSGQDRCEVSKLSDGVEFVANNLKAYENLTFDVEIKAGSFVVPAPTFNYMLVWIVLGLGVVLTLFTILGPVRWYRRESEKRKFYKGFFVKPEYQPNPEYSVAEMAEVYIGKKKEAKVAVLLDMIVRKKLAIKKTGEKKRKGWRVEVLSLDGVKDEGKTMLALLNGGTEPGVGDEIEIKARTATSKLVALGRKYDKDVVRDLKSDGLVEKNYKSKVFGVSTVVLLAFFAVVFGLPLLMGLLESMQESGTLVGRVVGEDWFVPVMMAEIIVAVVIWSVLHFNTEKYKVRTKAGLSMSRYVDGMKLYIGMAEADRLKFLQSVEGADTSNDGIVHLYEKMLPYAALLGLEDSWMKELEKYYKMEEVIEPDWYRSGITVRDMHFASTLASSYARSSSSMSSGGGSSSGFSGGGGGGFSGGGGGGGGGGGW